jgi:hypothetical protein
MAVFQSGLPGGSRNDFKGCTILDCIWNVTNHSYYVLDVLAWSNQPLLDCEVSDAQFPNSETTNVTVPLHKFLPFRYSLQVYTYVLITTADVSISEVV